MGKVIRLGSFFGGSFGVVGHPNQVYDYFAVESDIMASTQCAGGCDLVAFRSVAEAHQRMADLLAQSKMPIVKKR